MSEENVQVARRMIDAWNRGEIDEWANGLHEEVVWVPLAENPQTEPIQGIEAVRAFVLDWIEPWDEYTAEIFRIVDRGDWVVVGARHDAKHASGAEIRMDMYVAAAIRDGKGIVFRWFTDEAEALRAAGIESSSR
jgi:ketosteroid isomerase-like protein